MGIGMFLYSDLVTSILLGSQWMEASAFIGIWSLTGVVTVVFSYFSSEVYRSKGEPKISLITQVIHLGFLIPTLLLTVSHGFETLYIARSLVRVQGIFTGLIIMHVRYGFKIHHVLKNIFPMTVAAVIMGVAGFGLQFVADGLLWDLVAIVLCVIVYFTALFVLFPKTRREILDSAYAQKLLGKFKKTP